MPQYLINGVDKDSGFDTDLVVEADSEENARVKAELKGVVVTKIIPGDSVPRELGGDLKSSKLDGNADRTIWVGHPSHLYYWKPYGTGGILLLTGIWIGIEVIFTVLGVCAIAYALLDQRTRVYSITNALLISKFGIISLTTNEVNLSDIKTINMEQGIIERIFGLGTVRVGSAGSGRLEVAFKGIKSPAQVRDRVRKLKENSDRLTSGQGQ